MREVQPGLWETEPEFPAPGLSTHAYLWQGPDGNVLFYNTSLEGELDRMAELGGVSRQYLSHQDEIAPSLRTIRERYGATLHSSAAEAAIVEKTSPVDEAFDERRTGTDGVEVIPAPGHTPGSAVFLVRSTTGSTYLFTGDTILVDAEGRWFAGYIPGHSDRETLVRTLAELRELAPDVVISSAFQGDSGVTELGDRPWAECVDEALRSLDAART
ncbi:MBL fold metallo-hydrolase [Actinomadura adrarensis]|uniref:MBL fold metallo-hydrolase n=1 Tax=Actinomadura adrarensis TaxID=1819600 RepID=A0ABW3CR42_9ACTN